MTRQAVAMKKTRTRYSQDYEGGVLAGKLPGGFYVAVEPDICHRTSYCSVSLD